MEGPDSEGVSSLSRTFNRLGPKDRVAVAKDVLACTLREAEPLEFP